MAVAIFVNDGQDRSRNAGAVTSHLPVPDPGRNIEWRSAPAAFARQQVDPVRPDIAQNKAVSNMSVAGPSPFNRQLPPSNFPEDPLQTSQELTDESPKQSERARPRPIPKWVTHPQAALLLGTAVRSKVAESATSRTPSRENLPSAKAVRTATRVPETPVAATVSAFNPVVPVSRPAALALQENPDQPSWPRGPFSPEEELYRAQFGWAAFSAVLREEAIGPEEQH